QGLGERWAIRRVLQAVVEAGQFDVAKALVESSMQREEAVSEGGGRGEGTSERATGVSSDTKAEARWISNRNMAEDVLLSAATAHFNAAPSFRGGGGSWGGDLEAAERWLDLMPWSSPRLDQERRLHEAGRLAYDLGASDLVPLQLRLRLEGAAAANATPAVAVTSDSDRSAGAMAVMRDVLRCNPAAYSHGSGTHMIFEGWGGGEGMVRTPPGTGLMRLAGLMGLTSSDKDVDRVRALVARAALDNGDRSAACEVLSASILRRPPRRHAAAVEDAGQTEEEDESAAFATELCEVLDMITRQGDDERHSGEKVSKDVYAARTSELNAQALSRCSPSQIGPLIDSWSHFEAARFLSESVAATPAPDVGSFNGDEGGTICDHINDTDGLTPTSGKVKRHDMDHLAKSLMSEGMEPKAVATVLRALTSSGITGDISSHETPSTGDHDTVESDLGLPRKMAGTRSPRRAAEGALRLLLLRTFGECSHSPSAGADAWTVVSNRQLAVKEAELVAATSDDPRVDDLYRALDVLCLHLAKAELHSAVPVSEDPTNGASSDDSDVSDQADAAAHGTAVSTSTVLAPGVEFGVGPIERGVGYALVAADGRAVLAALRALLEEAEGTIKELRESRETDAANGDGRVVEIALEQVGKLIIEPDAHLVSALHKMGVSLNRARRACVATKNSSREAALAWCVEHADDPAMDTPLPLHARLFSTGSNTNRHAPATQAPAATGTRAREEGARAAHEVASCALEAYVQARLSGMTGDGGAGSTSGGTGVDAAMAASQEDMRELVSVLSTFRTRANLGAAEDRARSLLPGTDLTRFAGDAKYRQSKAASDIVALGREYHDTDAWSVAAAATSALLGPGYSKLRREGLTAASAAARIHAELRTGSDGNVSGGGLLEVLGEEAHMRGGTLEIARDVFIRFADGTDLHHMDLLLRVMAEGATTAATAAVTARGDREDVVITSPKSEAERRLSAHCGLVRRLLKAAPPGLDYKRLLGPDPLADPLADPAPPGSSVAASVAAAGSMAGVGASKPSKRSAAGLAAARGRVMAELRSVMELEHAPALSKLAKRVPGLTGSAVYLATAQRLLCGETGRLSQEALELLRGTSGATGGIDDVIQREEEADVASASVYHLVAPLLPKMVMEDLVEAVTVACVPGAAGGAGLASFPCRRHAKSSASGSSPPLPLSSSAPPFPDMMEPLRLTVRCRRRILADGLAALAAGKGTVVGGEAAAAGTTSTAAADERLTQLGALLRALDAAPIGGQTRLALEGAWVLTLRGPKPLPGVNGGGVNGTGGRVEMGGAYTSAEKAAAEAVMGMVEMGGTPTAVEAVCSSMQAALGLLPATQAARSNSEGNGASAAVLNEVHGDELPRHHLLDPSTVYATATSALLGRLVCGAQEDRALALHQLRAICIAATTPAPVAASIGGAGDRPLSRDGSSSAVDDVTPASMRAWGIIGSSLESFSRGDDDGYIGVLGGTVDGGAGAAAVYRARAEVVTLLKTIDYSAGVGRPSGGPPTTSHSSLFGTTRVDGSTVEVNNTDNGEDDNENWGEGGHGDRGGGGHVERKSSPSPPPPSLSFLRVAELAMENFSLRVAPQDVESWPKRSMFMQSLVSRVTGGGGGGGDGSPGEGEAATGGVLASAAMVEFMRQWWPKLLEVAVDAREWEFMTW
ncbi:unnamed protein product, partial [Sphacelaria rigidula]